MSLKIALLVMAVGAKFYIVFGNDVGPQVWLSTFLTGFIIAAVIFIFVDAASK